MRELNEILKDYLGCACIFFSTKVSSEELRKAYEEAQERGKKAGTVPVLLALDQRLMESLLYNASPSCNGRDFDHDEVLKYRENMLTQPLESGKEVLDGLLEGLREDAEIDGYVMEEVMTDELEDSGSYPGFISQWDTDTLHRSADFLVLTEIPVKNPWEVFAYLPFGGWNECPDTPTLMAVSKYWYEQYGAVVSVMTGDELEFAVPTPVSEDDALRLAKEQYVFCADIVDQGVGTTGALADSLYQSNYWYFWWD